MTGDAAVLRAAQGWVSPGFERVGDAFARSDLGRGGAAFSAYVDGRQVVDLWGGNADLGKPWDQDTLATMMSATKGCAALCALVLHDRGLLDVEAPVAEYWPEYAQAGKERTTVRQVLDHTSGMLCFVDPGTLLDWSGRGWADHDEIARRIASSPPAWEPGTRVGYHAISIGWLLQELVRRVSGRTLGKFFADEAATPLGLEISIGTPSEVEPRVAKVLSGPLRGRPGSTVARAAESAAEAAQRQLFVRVLARPGSRLGQAMLTMHGRGLGDVAAFLNLPAVRGMELPAANGSGSARSLARMYAALAGGGQLDGVGLASPDSVELFRTPSATGASALLPDWLPARVPRQQMGYALGFEGDFGQPRPSGRFGPTHESFGHLGAGGQLGFADPVRGVSVGFLRNHMADWSVSNALVQSLYDCL